MKKAKTTKTKQKNKRKRILCTCLYYLQQLYTCWKENFNTDSYLLIIITGMNGKKVYTYLYIILLLWILF